MQDDDALDKPVDYNRHQQVLAQLGMAQVEASKQHKRIEFLTAEVQKAGVIALELMKARAEIDSAWEFIQNGYSIESRAEVTAAVEAGNGFKSPLEMAMHLIWKRDKIGVFITPKDEDGDVVVQLLGVKHYHLAAHGSTLSFALERLREAVARLDPSITEDMRDAATSREGR
jgi:hypothetical protein